MAELIQLVAPLVEEAKKERERAHTDDVAFDQWFNDWEDRWCGLPFMPYNSYYWNVSGLPAKMPAVRFGHIQDGYAPMRLEQQKEARGRFLNPPLAAVNRLHPRSIDIFVELASSYIIVRRFMAFGPLLDQMARSLELPSAYAIDSSDALPRQTFAEEWSGFRVMAPPHRVLFAQRRAQIQTIDALSNKLVRVLAVLRSTIVELDFSEVAREPQPIPDVFVNIEKYVNRDHSVTIGNEVSIGQSAIGADASVSQFDSDPT